MNTQCIARQLTLQEQRQIVVRNDAKVNSSDGGFSETLRNLEHATSAHRLDPTVNLSIDETKRLPRNVANPEAIYKDNATGNLVFRYPIDKQYDAKVVFLTWARANFYVSTYRFP